MTPEQTFSETPADVAEIALIHMEHDLEQLLAQDIPAHFRARLADNADRLMARARELSEIRA